jgi:hypothetical protein
VAVVVVVVVVVLNSRGREFEEAREFRRKNEQNK